METVTRREAAHLLLDDVPDDDLGAVLEFLAPRATNGAPPGDSSYPATVPAFSGRPATPEEFEEFMAQYGPYMQPPDSEG
jgi:hypothetical protein